MFTVLKRETFPRQLPQFYQLVVAAIWHTTSGYITDFARRPFTSSRKGPHICRLTSPRFSENNDSCFRVDSYCFSDGITLKHSSFHLTCHISKISPRFAKLDMSEHDIYRSAAHNRSNAFTKRLTCSFHWNRKFFVHPPPLSDHHIWRIERLCDGAT